MLLDCNSVYFEIPLLEVFFHWFSRGTFCRIGWSYRARWKQKGKCMPPGTSSLATGQSCWSINSWNLVHMVYFLQQLIKFRYYVLEMHVLATLIILLTYCSDMLQLLGLYWRIQMVQRLRTANLDSWGLRRTARKRKDQRSTVCLKITIWCRCSAPIQHDFGNEEHNLGILA